VLEALSIQAERPGCLEEALLGAARFFVIQGVVHFPEVPLPAGSLGRYGCEFGTRMGTLIGVVAEDVDHAFAEGPSHAEKHLTQPTTVGTEKVLIDENG
jgi:hypothetical protein